MKKQLTLLLALFVIVLGCSIPSSVSSQEKKPDNQATPNDANSAKAAEAMKGLRDRLLTSQPEEIGLSKEDAAAKVWGALMEVAFVEGVVTVVSVRDGTASIYTNTGGGLLGGYSAQKEAKRFVEEAEKHVAGMKLTKTFPYPNVGRVTFYVLTQEGVYSSEGGEQDLMYGRHALSPLFLAGTNVMTSLRAASEKRKPD
mgnify:CR=1 FL=1